MNLSIQPQMNQNVTFNSRHIGMRHLLIALPVAATLSLLGCNSDRFEKQNSDAAESQTNIENLAAKRYNYDWDTTAAGLKHLDAISYKVGNNEKQLILDLVGNVEVEHTYKKDNNGNYIGFETVHHYSNGIGDLDAHRVVCDDINDSTRIKKRYDINGDLISKDSIVSKNGKHAEIVTTYGDSKLLK